MDVKSSTRPQHRRNVSSKTGIWKALVSSKPPSDQPEIKTSGKGHHARTQSVPLLPSDHPHSQALSERKLNAHPGPSMHDSNTRESKSASKAMHGADSPTKNKSSTNLASVFAKVNRSHKDLLAAAQKDKENTTPPVTPYEPVHDTPIYAQFATTKHLNLDNQDEQQSQSTKIREEIARYTPLEYSPGKQRNFNGSFDQPCLRPTLGSSRPQNGYGLLGSEGIVGAIGRRVSGGRSSLDIRRSSESARSHGKDSGKQGSGVKVATLKRSSTDRKVSGSSTEQGPVKDILNIAKRGGRVMAAVAALQGKMKDTPIDKDETALDAKTVDEAFEVVLAARNIPEPMRQKMRALTLRVKADFVKQDQEQSKARRVEQSRVADGRTAAAAQPVEEDNFKQYEDEGKSSKRSRNRSKTFTFSKGDKRSPTKRQRSGSKTRPTSLHIAKDAAGTSSTTPTTPTGSFGGLAGPSAIPTTYISYLRKTQDPTSVEVGRLHKLRILLRNETVTWVNSFVTHGGMTEVVGLLHRTMAIEWREDHEDQVLHEALLCLKALCTAECAMTELEKIADKLFPALLRMLFDDEKKGPAEYSTRTIIINVLSMGTSPQALEQRARQILAYLGEPPKPDDSRPVDFVLGMHTPRPYKLWCREVTHVTKEVFWIFLHHMNVVPLPTPPTPSSEAPANASAQDVLASAPCPATSYTARHFPGARAPVPAAPYIGGVEWDATTYVAAHLDLLNGIVASVATAAARNQLRSELAASGFEKVMGGTLRTCKEKFYAGVHDGLRAWAAAAAEDGWDTRFVREGPSDEERAEKALKASPRKSPKKKTSTDEPLSPQPPRLDPLPARAPMMQLSLNLNTNNDCVRDDDDGWVG